MKAEKGTSGNLWGSGSREKVRAVCRRYVFSLVLAWVFASAFSRASVLINEVMYHPVLDAAGEEWIELHNTGTNAVNLSGWRLSAGVDFTFGPYLLSAGDFVVVAADRVRFGELYPQVKNVVGDWTGRLSNRGERIECVDAAGARVDVVPYAHEGDWGLRQRGPLEYGMRGWIWVAEHNGTGKSLELICPDVPNDNGQNWSASLIAGGTPGTANSLRAERIAPLLTHVSHQPPLPRAGEPVRITATVSAAAGAAFDVFAWFRTNSAAPWTQARLEDDGLHGDGGAGDQTFGTAFAGVPNGTVVEWFIELVAADGQRRAWPAPARDADGSLGPWAVLLYQAHDGIYQGDQPALYLVLAEPERAALASGYRWSDARMNATLISTKFSGTDLRYNCSVRFRGAGARWAAVPSYRVDIPGDRRWDGAGSINLNAQFGYAQVAASALARLAGLPAAEARPAQVRVNGVNLAGEGPPRYGAYALLEVLDSDFAENQFPEDDAGNVYRASTGAHSADLKYLGTNSSSYRSAGYYKTSNEARNDWADLMELTWVLSTNTAPADYVAAVERVVQVDLWMRYFAVAALLESSETALATGVGDDYGLYRGLEDPRFQLLPHDFDTVLGEGDTFGNLTESIFLAARLPALDRFLKHPRFVGRYYQELDRLSATIFASESVSPLIDRALGDYVPDPVRQRMKEFSSARAAYVRSQIPEELTLELPVAGGEGCGVATNAVVVLGGAANPLKTAAIHVNGLPVNWSRWQRRWTHTLTLQAGMNSILVQAFDDSGNEWERLVHCLRWDAPALILADAEIREDSVWRPGAAPYRISGDVLVAPGATLQIEPGTTVEFDPEARLVVEGRLVIHGTAEARVHMAPSVDRALWRGILLAGTNQSHSIAFADLRGAAGPAVWAGPGNAVEIEQSIFQDGLAPAIRSAGAALLVRGSAFRRLQGGAVIECEVLPETSGVVLSGNRFDLEPNTVGVLSSGGRRPASILRAIENEFWLRDNARGVVFERADAYVAGNRFEYHGLGRAADDSAGVVLLAESELFNARNIYAGLPQALRILENSFLFSSHNTYAAGLSSVSFRDRTGAAPFGRGAVFEADIFWDNDRDFDDLTDPTAPAGRARLDRCLLRGAGLGFPGAMNLDADPRFRGVNDFMLAAGSPARYADEHGRELGAGIGGALIISGEPPALSAQSFAELSVGGPGWVEYRFRVNGGPWSEARSCTTGVSLRDLPSGVYVVEALGRDWAGTWQKESELMRSRPWTVDTARFPVRLNEVLAFNSGAVLVEGTTPDLIELYNESDQAIRLDGYALSDDPLQPGKFVFPAGSQLAGRDYLTLAARGGLTGAELGFALDSGGDVLIFSGPGGLIEELTFGPQIANYSIGRRADGSWDLVRPTFGAENIPAPADPPDHVRIHEWLANAPSGQGYIELFNPEPAPVWLGGCFLTDAPGGAPSRHPIAPLSFLGPGSYVVFHAGLGESGPDHLGFELSKDLGTIALFSPGLEPIDEVVYFGSSFGTSQGRWWGAPVAQGGELQPSPGAPNGPSQPGAFTVPWLDFNSLWRIQPAAEPTPESWIAPDFDDAHWELGRAALFSGSTALPLQAGTALPVSHEMTHRFRTEFFAWTNYSQAHLRLRVLADDGAVVFLNGTQLARVGLPSGRIDPATTATRTVGTAQIESFIVPATNLVMGRNFLAVELHQAAGAAADAAWAMSVEALIISGDAMPPLRLLNEIFSGSTWASNRPPEQAWLELYNAGTREVDLSGMLLAAGSDRTRQWSFPLGTTLRPGAFLLLALNDAAPPSRTAGPHMNAGFALDRTGDYLVLLPPPETGDAVLDSVALGWLPEHFSVGRDPLGEWGAVAPSPGRANVAAALGDPRHVRVNEWMAAPASGPDWFELFNPGDLPVALVGLTLSDDPLLADKFRFAPLSFIGPRGFHRLIADGDLAGGRDHAGFRLSASGDRIALFEPAGAALDEIEFGEQVMGVSEGRWPDGGSDVLRFPNNETPRASNHLPLSAVVINEVLPRAKSPREAAIELFNPAASSMDVSGWAFSGTPHEPPIYVFPQGSVIAGRAYQAVYQWQWSGPANQLGLASGEVWLSEAVQGRWTGRRAVVRFTPGQEGVAYGRIELSRGMDFCEFESSSFGRDDALTVEEFRSGAGSPNVQPRVGPVVLRQIMYHPPESAAGEDRALEFIEIENLSGEPVPLYDPLAPVHAWRLAGGVRFEFPTGFALAPGRRAVLVGFNPQSEGAARARFEAAYGSGALLLGPYQGQLSNSGEALELYQPDSTSRLNAFGRRSREILAERVIYSDSAGWPPEADGTGAALLRVGSFGNDSRNWTSAGPRFAAMPTVDWDSDGLPDEWELDHGLNPDERSDALADVDGDGASAWFEYRAGTDPQREQSVFDLTAVWESNGGIVLKFSAEPGRAYWIEEADSAQADAWMTFREIPAEATRRVIETRLTAAGQRFFRVRLALP